MTSYTRPASLIPGRPHFGVAGGVVLFTRYQPDLPNMVFTANNEVQFRMIDGRRRFIADQIVPSSDIRSAPGFNAGRHVVEREAFHVINSLYGTGYFVGLECESLHDENDPRSGRRFPGVVSYDAKGQVRWARILDPGLSPFTEDHNLYNLAFCMNETPTHIVAGGIPLSRSTGSISFTTDDDGRFIRSACGGTKNQQRGATYKDDVPGMYTGTAGLHRWESNDERSRDYWRLRGPVASLPTQVVQGGSTYGGHGVTWAHGPRLSSWTYEYRANAQYRTETRFGQTYEVFDGWGSEVDRDGTNANLFRVTRGGVQAIDVGGILGGGLVDGAGLVTVLDVATRGGDVWLFLAGLFRDPHPQLPDNRYRFAMARFGGTPSAGSLRWVTPLHLYGSADLYATGNIGQDNGGMVLREGNMLIDDLDACIVDGLVVGGDGHPVTTGLVQTYQPMFGGRFVR